MSVNIVHSDGSLEKIAGMGFGGGVPSGGTTGQVLAKKSNTDYDAEWKNGGDMLASVYDPDGNVAEAGGIEEYVGVRYDTMPEANAGNLSKMVQYVGGSYGELIKGHFYVCESDGAVTPSYAWVDITNEKAILLHTHSTTGDTIFNATNVWLVADNFIPAHMNATVRIFPKANKSFTFMLLKKNSETSYTILESHEEDADASGTPFVYAISKSAENRYIGLHSNDSGLTYNVTQNNNNREFMAYAPLSSFVDGTSNSFLRNTNIMFDFSYELSLEKSVRVGNVYFPVVVDASGHGDFTTINDAVNHTQDGDTIYIRKGIYDESVDVRNHRRIFIGESKDNTFWVKSSADYSTPPLNINDGIVENLTIIGGYGLAPSYEQQRTSYAIHADLASSTERELVVKNCNLISNVSAAIGIGVQYNQKITVEDCYLESKAEKTWSSGGSAFFNQGAIFVHNDANVHAESSAYLSVENCKIKGVKNAAALNAVSETGLTIRFLQNTLWSTDNGTDNAVNIMATPVDGHFVGDAIDLDITSFGNNIGIINVAGNSLSDLTDISLTTPQSGDVLVYDGEKWGNKEIEGINKDASYVEVTETLSHAYIWNNNGNVVDSPSSNMLTIDVVEGEEYRITGIYRYRSALYGFYADSQATSGTTYPNDEQSHSEAVTEEVNIIIPSGVTVLRASSYGASIKVEKLAGVGKLSVDFGGNILYKKKWCACGDSFTEGDFSDYTDSEGHTGKASDAYDPVKQMWKAYPWLISNRNNMNLQLLAKGGNDFTNVEGAERPFSNSDTSQYNYTQIATDCDYITLSFGLNEVNLTAEQIGTSADTTNETLWGAYYVVLNSILTANPTVKIGIIIPDAWMCDNTTYYNVLKEIAEYWGIPYLDLSGGDNKVPMMINRRGTISSVAKTLRGTAMATAYGTNNHPNPAGHRYRSTVIENFLRSL